MAVKKVVKKASKKKAETTLGDVVMVYTKGSTHWWALVEPKIVELEGMSFVEGSQVTGKKGHRMEGKRTLIPFDHVASIVAFASEEEIWSAPQPKNLPVFEEQKPTVLTHHEQTKKEPRDGDRGARRPRNNSRRRQNKGTDARFQEQYDSNRDRNFNR